MSNKWIIKGGKFVLSGDQFISQDVKIYSINTSLSNIQGHEENPDHILSTRPSLLLFTPSTGYALPNIVEVTGSNYKWNNLSGELLLSKPVDHVSVSMSGISTAQDCLCFTANENTEIKFNKQGSNWNYSPSLEYKINDGEWTSYKFGDKIKLSINDKCYCHGDNESFSESTSKYIKFNSTKNISVSGSVMSLLDSNCQSLTIPNSYCFYDLFGDNSRLLNIPELPAINLKPYCYYNMFKNCNQITSCVNKLPSEDLQEGCYESMFEKCEKLVTAPILPAMIMKNSCYLYMFKECKSLLSTPKLQADTLAESCYRGMFSDCESLTTITSLPAITLCNYCYQEMFHNCKNLEVNDSPSSTAIIEWVIPNNDVFTNSIKQSGMFGGCKGKRSSNDLNAVIGTCITYYTQNNIL